MMSVDEAMHLAAQWHSEGKLAEAQTILDQILEKNPKHAQALHLLGIIAYQRGNSTLAVEFIQKAIHSNPNIAVFHSNLGEMYRILKSIDLSIQSGKCAVALDSSSATAWSNLGIAYYEVKQYEEAEKCHQRALAIHPRLACSLNNMGSIYKEYGTREKAITYYQAALTAAPAFVDPWSNLGILFLEQQEFSQALVYFSRVHLITPNCSKNHCNLGLALLGLEQYDNALFYFQKALRLNPHYAEAYYGVAKVYLNQQDYMESEQNIRKAIAENPAQLEFYQLLALIYNEQGDHIKALSYFDQALSFNTTDVNVSIGKGNVFMEMGEISKAEEQFLNIAQHPSMETRISAHYSLVQLSKIQSNHPSVKELLSIANDMHNLPRSHQEYVYFALGKCFDDMGAWSKAFEYFNKGCAIKRNRISYNITDQLYFTKQLMASFTQERIEYLRVFSHPSALPIFIVGMPRSGSTLVEQLLSSHPHVHGAGELKYLNDLIHWPIKSQDKITRYPENTLQWSGDICRAITDKYLNYIQRFSSDARHITDKMPHNFIAMGVIHALFPHAKIVHIQRNPIDTCLSCYTKLFSQGHVYSYDLTELGQYYNCYEQIIHHWRQVLPSNAWLDIHYEDIIHNLEAEAKRLFAFCDLPWNPSCLTFYESKRHVRTASFAQVRQPLYTSSVERWRRFEKELAPLIQVLKQRGETFMS